MNKNNKYTTSLLLIGYYFCAYAIYQGWTANTRTYVQAKVTLAIVLIGIGIYAFLLKTKLLISMRKFVGWTIIVVFVVTNSVLSYHAFTLYSIQAISKDIPPYSQYLPPNGDLAVLQEVLEGRNIVLTNEIANINEVCRKLGNNISVESMDFAQIKNEINQHNFVDMGQMDGLYFLYAPLFDIQTGIYETAPSLFIEPFDNSCMEDVIVVEDQEKNVYVYTK